MEIEPIDAMRERIKELFEITAEDVAAIEANARRNEIIALAAFKKGQSSPKVKQLEWVLESGGWHISMTRFGVSYEIGESKNDGNFILYDILLTTTIHDTIDEAKAAAQADFERRVMECFDM